jgi:hypothetical protein
MKKTTCRNLKGACDELIFGETPDEMGENSKKHVMKMVQMGDEAHKKSIDEMMKLSSEEQHAWYEEFRNNFTSLEEK